MRAGSLQLDHSDLFHTARHPGYRIARTFDYRPTINQTVTDQIIRIQSMYAYLIIIGKLENFCTLDTKVPICVSNNVRTKMRDFLIKFILFWVSLYLKKLVGT